MLEFIRAYYDFDGLPFDEGSIRKGLEFLLKSPEYGQVFLIRHNAQNIGYTILTYAFDLEFGGRQAFLTDLYIEAAYRNQGFGSQALNELERFAQSRGLAALELQVEKHNQKALAFYPKLGFQVHERITMSKRL